MRTEDFRVWGVSPQKETLHLHSPWDPHSSAFVCLSSEQPMCHNLTTCCRCLFFSSLINYFLHICFFLWCLVSWPYCQRLLDCNLPCMRISKALYSIGKAWKSPSCSLELQMKTKAKDHIPLSHATLNTGSKCLQTEMLLPNMATTKNSTF